MLKKNKKYIGLHVEYPLFLSNFNGPWIFSTDLKKKSANIKFNENPSSGSRGVQFGRTDRRADEEVSSRFSLFSECT